MVFSTILFVFRFLPITLALYYLAPAKWKNRRMILRRFLFYLYKERSPIQFAFAVKTESGFFSIHHI